MRPYKALRSYLLGAILVWSGIILAIGVVAGSRFGEMIPILGGGAFWFIVIVPNLFREIKTGD